MIFSENRLPLFRIMLWSGCHSSHSAAGIERIGDVPRQLAGRHQDDVEADKTLRVVGMACEPELGGGDDALLGALGDRFRRGVEIVARLDLDEDQVAAAPRYDVDFADRGFEAPRRDAKTLGDEQHGGATLRRKAEPECRDALRPRRGFWRTERLNAARHDRLLSQA